MKPKKTPKVHEGFEAAYAIGVATGRMEMLNDLLKTLPHQFPCKTPDKCGACYIAKFLIAVGDLEVSQSGVGVQ